MIRSLRRSFAAKLIVGGCLLALVVVGGVASYLIFSRTTQTRAAAQSNADNRVGVMAQVLDRFTGAESLNAAASVANQAALRQALTGPAPAAAVPALFQGASVDLAGQVLLISDAGGSLLVIQQSPSLGGVTPITIAPEAMRFALRGGSCQRAEGGAAPGACGTEMVAADEPAYVVALPVTDSTGRVVGAVAYAAPLAYQLHSFQALFGFPTAFISAQHPDREFRPDLAGTSATDPALRAALADRPPTSASGGAAARAAIYDAPVAGGGTGSVAGSFTPVRGPAGELTGYVGVEVPVAQFTGDERTDIIVLALIAVFVLLLVALMVVVFVARFVKSPVARLEHGVARIAGGDYATDINVQSDDELGRLASNVNRMRVSIAGYVREIEAARERLDAAVERISGVSRALTTTTTGVDALQGAVVQAAASIAGRSASAMLVVREKEKLDQVAQAGLPQRLEDWTGVESVLDGQPVRIDHEAGGVLVAVPMYYQDEVIGALAVVTPHAAAGEQGEPDVDVLAVLANNAAIAMENARLFEQERQTVQRLRELDAMKSDFMATVQHELRTPLTAIMGMSDLLEMCWTMWEDGPKIEAVQDIQVAAKNLYDIVETIIDFSTMDESQLHLQPTEVPLRAMVDSVLDVVGERYKGGLPVPVDVVGDADVEVMADPERLSQVLRALLDNAMKFSDGQGRTTISFAPVEGGGTVRIEVADQGSGIPAEDLPRIFDRFYQADNTATRKYGGTGMGLALVKRMVQAHGASVTVASVPREGTRVVLLWPSPQPAPAATEAPATAAAG